MSYRTVQFKQYTRKAYTSVVCLRCGKRRKRQKKFMETRSPFNKNDKGEVKTVEEIRTSLGETCDEWKSKVKLCSTCEKEERGW